MEKQTINGIEQMLEDVNEKIVKKESNARGSLYMFGVGLAGIAYGVLTKSDSSLMSGMVVSSGSLIFKVINSLSLKSLRYKQYSYRYALKYDNVNEQYFKSKGGKHFKK